MGKNLYKKTKKGKRSKGTIVIVGIGYVGLPLACLCAEKGYRVIGIGRNKDKVTQINQGQSPISDPQLKKWLKRVEIFATTDFNYIKEANVVIVCVPTPVDITYNPDLRLLKNALQNVTKYLKKDHLIIIESTINPGVTEEIIKPILEKSGLRAGQDFYLAHSPERINPGDRFWTVKNIPRILGAYSKKGLKKAIAFYKSVLEAEVRPMNSLKEAEATKILENSFRDINIAFINEIAKSFNKLGIDVMDVIEGAKTKPFAFLAHYPSCGIGGHCIPVDPYYLIERARKEGFDHKFLKLAREINNSMPNYTVTQLKSVLDKLDKKLKNTKIGILGLAYKADIDDTRESPAYKIIKILKKKGAKLIVYDPYVEKDSNVKSLDDLLKRAEVLIIATDHKEFKDLDARKCKKNKIKAIIDGKNCLNKEKFIDAHIIYKGIGR